MKAIYNNHIIQAVKREDGYYHATIDGEECGISSKYKLVTVRRAVQACQEQEREQVFQELREAGL